MATQNCNRIVTIHVHLNTTKSSHTHILLTVSDGIVPATFPSLADSTATSKNAPTIRRASDAGQSPRRSDGSQPAAPTIWRQPAAPTIRRQPARRPDDPTAARRPSQRAFFDAGFVYESPRWPPPAVGEAPPRRSSSPPVVPLPASPLPCARPRSSLSSRLMTGLSAAAAAPSSTGART